MHRHMLCDSKVDFIEFLKRAGGFITTVSFEFSSTLSLSLFAIL